MNVYEKLKAAKKLPSTDSISEFFLKETQILIKDFPEVEGVWLLKKKSFDGDFRLLIKANFDNAEFDENGLTKELLFSAKLSRIFEGKTEQYDFDTIIEEPNKFGSLALTDMVYKEILSGNICRIA